MRLYLAAAAALLFVGPASAQDMARDIAAIQTSCPTTSFSRAVDLISCEDSYGRAVMLRYDASDVDLFDVAAADRLKTARDVDAGRVTMAFAAQRLQYIAGDLATAIQRRRQGVPQAQGESAPQTQTFIQLLALGLRAYAESKISRPIPRPTVTNCVTLAYSTTCTTQ